MNHSFFAAISRMKYIDRWALMRNSRPENLSEHSMEVAMIAHALCLIGNVRYGRNLNGDHAAVLGLYHDAPEIITGDLPTPVKYFDPEIKQSYDRVEQSAKKKMIAQLPEEMQLTYDGIMNAEESEDDILIKYVKAADKLSALIKCIEEERSGNQDFEKAKEATMKTIQGLKMPEVDFFLDNFLPGYYMTLDEQTDQSQK